MTEPEPDDLDLDAIYDCGDVFVEVEDVEPPEPEPEPYNPAAWLAA